MSEYRETSGQSHTWSTIHSILQYKNGHAFWSVYILLSLLCTQLDNKTKSNDQRNALTIDLAIMNDYAYYRDLMENDSKTCTWK